VADLVGELRSQVEANAPKRRSAVRWVRLDGLHLTLRFLGPTSEERVAAVARSVDAAAAGRAPVDIEIGGGGAFPSPSRPRTIWLGLIRGKDQLADLARAVDTELTTAGWEPQERPLRAHLTLARADGRREGPAVARRLIERASALRVPFRADRLVLFESVTGGGPARYVARHEARLGE
jgi:RNA 2',3'-cyclic 3'-phosphodiesterase